MSDLEVVWSGATHRTFPQPVLAMAGPSAPLYRSQRGKAARTRMVVLAAVTAEFDTVRVIAARAGVHADTARPALQAAIECGDVETRKVAQRNGPRQTQYRRAHV